MISVDNIKKTIQKIAPNYDMKRVYLFGSRANGTSRKDSDIDLLIEFAHPVSLLVLAAIKVYLEELWNLPVDIIHGPIREDDFIEINGEIELYAA